MFSTHSGVGRNLGRGGYNNCARSARKFLDHAHLNKFSAHAHLMQGRLAFGQLGERAHEWEGPCAKDVRTYHTCQVGKFGMRDIETERYRFARC